MYRTGTLQAYSTWLCHLTGEVVYYRTCRLRLAQGDLFGVPRSRMAFSQMAISCPFFVQISSNFVFSSEMLNFAISFVFRPKRISCVPSHNALNSVFGPVCLELPSLGFWRQLHENKERYSLWQK